MADLTVEGVGLPCLVGIGPCPLYLHKRTSLEWTAVMTILSPFTALGMPRNVVFCRHNRKKKKPHR